MLQQVTVYQVGSKESNELKALLKENGIKASVRLGTNRWYILVNAKKLNEKALDLIEGTGKYQAISLVHNTRKNGLLNISGQMMIERISN